nr:NAD-dependent epimerase/dehydratase family protein [uncultured Sphingomonas sp.]
MSAHSALQFPEPLALSLKNDRRRIIITGASGWIGRTALAMLHDALGDEAFADRVRIFGSSAKLVHFGNGQSLEQRPLSELSGLDHERSLLFHLAFLTMDKVSLMSAESYMENTRLITDGVIDSLAAVGVDRLFIASSGAAQFFDRDGPGSPIDLYGRAKLYEEARAAEWAAAGDDRHAIIARIFSLTGPYINKPEIYAISSFIRDALAGEQITVRATKEIRRSYVPVTELVSLALAILLDKDPAGIVTRFDTGGEHIELGELAQKIDRLLGGQGVERAEITNSCADNYVGDQQQYLELLEAYGVARTSLDDQILLTAQFINGVAQSMAIRPKSNLEA